MGIASTVGMLFTTIGRARATQTTYTHYSNMSDEALASRGMTRQDIARVALKDVADF